MSFDFRVPASLVQEHASPALTRQLAFSPDGLLLLAADEGGGLATYHLPLHTFVNHGGRAAGDTDDNRVPLAQASRVAEAGALRDACWHPRAAVADPACAVYATASKDQPLHLWDCLSGGLRANYVATNQSDEVVGAYAAAFSPDGATLVGGYERALHAFDVARPGSARVSWLTSPTRASKSGQRGIISSVAFSPAAPAALAAGCFDGSVAGYDARSGRAVATYTAGGDDGGGGGGDVVDYRLLLAQAAGGAGGAPAAAAVAAQDGGSPLAGHKRQREQQDEAGAATSSSVAAAASSSAAGASPAAARQQRSGPPPAVTQVAYSPDGTLLCAGYRRCDDVRVWDARKPSAPLYRLQRDAAGTNQRLQFGLDGVGRHLVTGTRDGCVVVYDLLRGECARVYAGFADAVAAVALHPNGVAFATAVGQRHPAGLDDSDSDIDADGGGGGAMRLPSASQRRRQRQPAVAIWRTALPLPSQPAEEPAAIATAEAASAQAVPAVES
jgi:WD40 repeat protein